MGFTLSISLTAPFSLDELLAECDLEDETIVPLVLVEGQFSGEVPAPPMHLRLVYEHPESRPTALRSTSAGAAEPSGSSVSSAQAQGGVELPPAKSITAEAEELFERGIRIPDDGRLVAQLVWGIHCHQTSASPSHVEIFNNPRRGGRQQSETTRFLSSEHVACGQLVGKDADGMALIIGEQRAPFHAETPLPIGGKQATFGQIVALAGDFYAYLDEEAHKALPSAWPDPPLVVGFLTTDYRRPTLNEDSAENVETIVKTFKREAAQLAAGVRVGAISELFVDGVKTQFPVRRYLALASQNHCHFGAQPPDGSIDDTVNEALALYRYYHQRAVAEAQQAGRSEGTAAEKEQRLLRALAVDAFGCHFLTDLFASGHLRVPRRMISERFGVMRGALGMAHAMHDEDNRLGLWCTTRRPQTPRVVWRAFGDGMLTKPVAAPHLTMVREAVRRSAAAVFISYCGKPPASEDDAHNAEAILPVALAAGTAPGPEDVLPESGAPTPSGSPNHFPLYALLRSRHGSSAMIVARRVDAKNPHHNLYVEQGKKDSEPFPLMIPSP